MSAFVRPNAAGRMECADYPATRDFFYHDCDSDTAAWAFSQLTAAPVEFLTQRVHLQCFWSPFLSRAAQLAGLLIQAITTRPLRPPSPTPGS
jgi:hypothetical protein